MPEIAIHGARLHYEEHGDGPETVVLAHGLLLSGEMFRQQVKALVSHYRCITFDFRGQGGSQVTETGYDMDNLAEDAVQLIRRLEAAPCHFVGLSMGGFVGMRLALRHPELLRSLSLLATSADAEDPDNVPRYRLLAFVARWLGPRAVAGRVMPILFGQTFLEDSTRAAERLAWHRRIGGNHRLGVARAAHGVFERESVYEHLGGIRTPTLVLVGDEDVATTPDRAHRIHQAIPGARLVEVPRAGHSLTIEEPGAVNAALMQFLANVGTATGHAGSASP